MDKEDYNVVTLDDGIEYTEISRLTNNDITYIFLSDLSNPKNFCIKKIVIENDGEYIQELDNLEEFDRLFKLFTDKMLNKTNV